MNEHFPDIVDYQFTAVMENRLDTIASGEEALSEVLSDFYKGFSSELAKAESKLAESAPEVPAEETDIICDGCGSKMIIKNGRFGKFAACPNYPKCKFTKALNKDGTLVVAKKTEIADFKCEICGSDVLIRNGQFGEFYACSNYPKCSFMTWDLPAPILCPECSSAMKVVKENNSTKYVCLNRKCNHTVIPKE